MTKLYSQPLPPQVHPELPSHFRMPELYLEAGAALLMAHRPADCMALCEEVVTSTLELLPEKAMLEAEPVVAAAGEKVKMLLWTGAAYLLQGHSQAHLKDWKQAVTQYTRCQTGSKNAHECIWEFLNVNCPLHSRCINLLVKVRFRQDRGKWGFFLSLLKYCSHFEHFSFIFSFFFYLQFKIATHRSRVQIWLTNRGQVCFSFRGWKRSHWLAGASVSPRWIRWRRRWETFSWVCRHYQVTYSVHP